VSRTRGRDPAGLQHLRARLTAVFAASAAAILVVFVLLLLTTSTRLERERLDADLTGAASRATALIYDDERGRTTVEGVQDDELLARGMPLLVVAQGSATARPEVLLAVGTCDRAAALALARRAEDVARGVWFDRPVHGTVPVEGEERRAAALAWARDDGRPGGAVVVLAASVVDLSTNWLALPAGAGAGAVLALLAAVNWLIAGRSLRPAAAALADRETFLSTAAHELRGPVARLRAGAEAARRAARPGDPARVELGRLITVADSAAHVVSNLLLATRAERGEVPVLRHPIDLAVLAGELEHSYPAVLVDVVEPAVVDGDPGLLRHALANLVDNAIRHGRVGDVLPGVDVAVRSVRGRAVVRVVDDGPGFPPDVDVLARFASGGPTGGTGLGLPLVAWIVERHGGVLRLDAAPGGGAVVEIRLPLAPGAGPGRSAGRGADQPVDQPVDQSCSTCSTCSDPCTDTASKRPDPSAASTTW
jgi:two-component system, OmpR family, sensor kinase